MSSSVIVPGTAVGLNNEHGQPDFVRVNDTVFETPFSVAVTSPVPFADSVPARTINVPLFWAAFKVIEAGVVSSALLSDSVRVVGLGAGPVKTVVQVETPPDASDKGEQVSELRETDGCNEIKVLRVTPFRKAAITTTLLSPPTSPARAMKLADD